MVDDDVSILQMMASILRDAGYAVLAAHSGKDALHALQPPPEKLDLLVTDVEMPGMNGHELARRVESEWPSTRIMLVSGFNLRNERLDPSWCFLAKPFTSAQLRERVRECLARDRD